MTINKYPDEKTFDEYTSVKEPLIMAISFDGDNVYASRLDDSFEHHILLANFGLKQTDIDKYFRVVVDEQSAEWTFVCPPNYKNIKDRQKRITAFYNDGFAAISRAISELGYYSDITIPKRYRRHFDVMGDDSTTM